MGCCAAKENGSAQGGVDDTVGTIETVNLRANSSFSARRRYRRNGDACGSDDGDDPSSERRHHPRDAPQSPRDVLQALREEYPPTGDPSGIDLIPPPEDELTELQQHLRNQQQQMQQSGMSVARGTTDVNAATASAPNTNDEQSLATPAGASLIIGWPAASPPQLQRTSRGHGADDDDGDANDDDATPDRPPPPLLPPMSASALFHQQEPTAAASSSGPGAPSPARTRYIRLAERVWRWMAHHTLPPPRPIYCDTTLATDAYEPDFDGSSSGFNSSTGGGGGGGYPSSDADTQVHAVPPQGAPNPGGVCDPDCIDDLPLGADAVDMCSPYQIPHRYNSSSHLFSPAIALQLQSAAAAGGGSGTYTAQNSNNGTLRRKMSQGGGSGESSSMMAAMAGGGPAPAAFPSPALLRISSLGSRRRGASFNTQVSSSDGIGTGRASGESAPGTTAAVTAATAAAANSSSAATTPPQIFALIAAVAGNSNSGEFVELHEQAPAVMISGIFDNDDDSPGAAGFPVGCISTSPSQRNANPNGGGDHSSAGPTSPPTASHALSPAGALALPGFSRRASRLSEQNVADVPQQDDMLDYFAPTPLATTSTNLGPAAVAGGGGGGRPRSAFGYFPPSSAAAVGSHSGGLSSPDGATMSGSRRESDGSAALMSVQLVPSPPQIAHPSASNPSAATGGHATLVRSSSNAIEPDELIPGFVWSMAQEDANAVSPSK